MKMRRMFAGRRMMVAGKKMMMMERVMTGKKIPVGTVFSYIINDPTTPELKKDIPLPEAPGVLNFKVVGLGRSLGNEVSLQAANVYNTIVTTLNYFINLLQDLDHPISRWHSTSTLQVIPRAGKDFNAYYDRQNLKFFFDTDTTSEQRIYCADSANIVSHELGHAILDIIRSDFWNAVSLETWALHESFADIVSLVQIMLDDIALNAALNETNNDLTQSNVISKLAEQLGLAIYDVYGGDDGSNPAYLRNAVNNFNYVSPNSLPSSANDDELSSEPHSFSRVWTGTWYDILTAIYEIEKQTQSPINAIKTARDVAIKYLLEAVLDVPKTPTLFSALAQLMLQADENAGSPYQSAMIAVFDNRNINVSSLRMLSNTTWNEANISLTTNDVVKNKKTHKTIRLSSPKYIKLCDYQDVSTMSVDGLELSNIQLLSANDTYYKFDKNGILTHEISANEGDVFQDAQSCLKYIQDQKDIGPGFDTTWFIKDGKLERTLIVCSCCH